MLTSERFRGVKYSEINVCFYEIYEEIMYPKIKK